MRPVDHTKVLDDFGRKGDGYASPFATSPSAPGWVSNAHFLAFVGEGAAKERFEGAWLEPLEAKIEELRRHVVRSMPIEEELALAIPGNHDPLGYDGGQRVWCRGKTLVAIQFCYAPLLDGLKVVHAGTFLDPLIGLDDGEIVAVVIGLKQFESHPLRAEKRRQAIARPVP